MKILGFDISKSKTGWAFWDDSAHFSSIIVGSFVSKGDTFFETVQSFHPQFVRVIREHKPDYVIFEEGLNNIKAFKSDDQDLAGEFQKLAINSKSALVLHRLLGDVQAVLLGLRIAHESVAVETWRKSFLGYGRKAGMGRTDYKKAARATCEKMGIQVKNDDQAEAVGLVWHAGRTSQHVKMIKHGAAA